MAAFTLAVPTTISWWRRLAWAVFFIALASVPDWPVPGWGHYNLGVSHSLWVNVAFCIALAAILRKWSPDL